MPPAQPAAAGRAGRPPDFYRHFAACGPLRAGGSRSAASRPPPRTPLRGAFRCVPPGECLSRQDCSARPLSSPDSPPQGGAWARGGFRRRESAVRIPARTSPPGLRGQWSALRRAPSRKVARGAACAAWSRQRRRAAQNWLVLGSALVRVPPWPRPASRARAKAPPLRRRGAPLGGGGGGGGSAAAGASRPPAIGPLRRAGVGVAPLRRRSDLQAASSCPLRC